MRTCQFCFLACSVFFVLLQCVPATAQSKLTENTWRLDDPKARTAAQIEQLDWLAGTWQGTGLGGECEEWWGQPRNARMQGAFRFDQKDKLVFSEHFVMSEEAGSLVLKLKHFSGDFKGWESQDECQEFRLVAIEGKEARFEGLTYRLAASDRLEVYVVINDTAGEQREEKFEFQRR